MKQENLIKILLFGDYSIFRSALRMLIEQQDNLTVVGEASDQIEAASLILNLKPDVVLVDLPDNSQGSDFFSFLTELEVKPPLLILTGSDNFETSQKYLKLGTSGIVLKKKSAEVLFKAIEKVHDGEYWFDRSIMGHTIRQLIHEKQFLRENLPPSVHDDLTEREKQVVNLICEGLKNKTIAEKLFITETTVRHHLSSIFDKLSISSRLELVVYAFRNKIVKIPVPNSLNQLNNLKYDHGSTASSI